MTLSAHAQIAPDVNVDTPTAPPDPDELRPWDGWDDDERDR